MKNLLRMSCMLAVACAVVMGGAVKAAEEGSHSEHEAATTPAVEEGSHSEHEGTAAAEGASSEFLGDAYSLTTCPVSGKPLPEEPQILTIEGREFRTCCEKCAAKLQAEPASYIAKVDEAMIAQQTPFISVDTCPVTKEKIAEGEGETYVYKNRAITICCGACKKKIAADPAAYFSLLDEQTIAKQSADYPLTECVASGKPLTEDAQAFVVANRLVKTCCGKCAAKVKANPAAYLAKLDAAKK